MIRRALVLAAVALPVVGTLAGIAVNEAALRGATEWRIPITGYDPRDPLRGHYLRFQYDWAARGNPALCDRGTCRLCLEDGGRRVLVTVPATACPAPVDPVASSLAVGWGAAPRAGRLTAASRLWVSEARATVLQEQLRDRPMVAVARLTRDGRLLAERIEPAR